MSFLSVILEGLPFFIAQLYKEGLSLQTWQRKQFQQSS